MQTGFSRELDRYRKAVCVLAPRRLSEGAVPSCVTRYQRAWVAPIVDDKGVPNNVVARTRCQIDCRADVIRIADASERDVGRYFVGVVPRELVQSVANAPGAIALTTIPSGANRKAMSLVS